MQLSELRLGEAVQKAEDEATALKAAAEAESAKTALSRQHSNDDLVAAQTKMLKLQSKLKQLQASVKAEQPAATSIDPATPATPAAPAPPVVPAKISTDFRSALAEEASLAL